MTEPDLLALGRGSGNSCPVYSWLPSYSLCRLHKPGWEGCRAAEADNQASHYGCRSGMTMN